MKKYPEVTQHGVVSIENIPQQLSARIGLTALPSFEGDLGVQIAEDGRVWINIDGVCFLRFKPTEGLGR